MPRPIKLRQVTAIPAVTLFKPAGVPLATIDVVTLSLEEMESIRLKDMEGRHQEDCARQMGISRATFHTILKSAHQKIADALLNGKAIQVEGGLFALPGGRFRCRRDGMEWNLPPGPLPGARSVSCPTCRGTEVQPVPTPHPSCPGGGRGRKGRGWQIPWGPPNPAQQSGSVRRRLSRTTQPGDEPPATAHEVKESPRMTGTAPRETHSTHHEG